MKKYKIIATVLAAMLMLTGAGCDQIKQVFSSSPPAGDLQGMDTPVQVLANEAEAYYREGDYEDAADLFQQIKDRFPYSRLAVLADLRVGDAYFKAKRYDEAVLAFEDFVQLHPTNEAVPYALYQTGMVYHAQMLTPDRDPTFSSKAVAAFMRLISAYPTDEWAIKARPRLVEVQRNLAAHDMSVGKFYFNTKRYKAAISRFKKVLTKYPDVGLYEEAMNLLRQSQVKLAKADKDQDPKTSEDRSDLVSPPMIETPTITMPQDHL